MGTPEAFVCEPLRTPIGRYARALAKIRADDLAALPIIALRERFPDLDLTAIDDVYLGCANQAGEDNRNVARIAALLAGLPSSVPGVTFNRLCSSGLEAVGAAARTVKLHEADLIIAGGVESMSRSPFVVAKAAVPFDRNVKMEDTTLGWRFVNPLMKAAHGIDSMAQTAENVAAELGISRQEQDAYALRSQRRVQAAGAWLLEELIPVNLPGRKGEGVTVDRDEHPRPDITAEKLAKLPPLLGEGGTITAGNASGINDGAAAMFVASARAVEQHDLEPLARILGMASAGVPPRVMGLGPVPATRKLLARSGVALADIDVIEINEAFAAQVLGVLRQLGLPDDAAHVNPNGGAIALGHPLGMSGARLVTTAARELHRRDGRYALCTLCVGVGQGLALLMERT